MVLDEELIQHLQQQQEYTRMTMLLKPTFYRGALIPASAINPPSKHRFQRPLAHQTPKYYQPAEQEFSLEATEQSYDAEETLVPTQPSSPKQISGRHHPHRLISDGDECVYRRVEVEQLVSWCSSNNLELNAQKTVEMIVDFRKVHEEIT
ncbi:hypothetical protein WMY93_001964 [Mugilogobius chulae]|uniref:Uncharacterized protein n=1 Tax=Mugilogobius chulae TaxID=88201 RepID=A0AAW0PTJ2_9GOBI